MFRRKSLNNNNNNINMIIIDGYNNKYHLFVILSFIFIQHQTAILHTDKKMKLYLCLFVLNTLKIFYY